MGIECGMFDRTRLSSPIFYPREDELIPLAYATDVRDPVKAADSTLVVIPGAGHNDILFRGMELYFESIRTFVAWQSG